MSARETRLISRSAIAEGTMKFSFEKPEDFRFKPGQAIDIVLAEQPRRNSQRDRHTFSLVSAPFQDELCIATRVRDSAFKQALTSLPIGSTVWLDGPFGSLTLHDDRARPAVFIAGGIGVTPFMSILRQAVNDQLQQWLVLLYANRRPEDAAFLTELHQLTRQLVQFRLFATMTQMGKSSRPWNGSTGHIDVEMLKAVAREMTAPIYYVAGPPPMVGAMRQTLNSAGIPDGDIRSEEFYGY